MQRLVDGAWQPGQVLPSEMELAAETGVSQGTVRKALDALAGEKLLVRRQGRGTFVAEHDEARILFQFFKLQPDEGEQSFPESRILGCVRVAASDTAEARCCGLPRGGGSADRAGTYAGGSRSSRNGGVPVDIFGDLGTGEIPNNLYGHYAQRFGITVSQAREKLKAIGA